MMDVEGTHADHYRSRIGGFRSAVAARRSQSPAKAEFYRTPAGEVKYRYVRPDFQGPYYFYYRGFAYPYYPGLAYRERTGELRPTDQPHRERVAR
jgi:hypothetical protein